MKMFYWEKLNWSSIEISHSHLNFQNISKFLFQTEKVILIYAQ
jgi:hypothetical protein